MVRLLCDRVIVMRAGEILEQGSSDEVLAVPKTRYTENLLAQFRARKREDALPSAQALPYRMQGCRYSTTTLH